MSYVVLARKWRPQSFEDLVGQSHVSRTLANAIAGDRVAHAFLFTGVRGIGKTTSARILAKALNCEKGPTASPCQVCPQCSEIGDGVDIDVQEIDGASYTGVDEVRRLQEHLPYRPARDRFKIYIVDEVHMLSQSAWNAFLKTLEEPPPHVKFIFATTEVHKVPVTILSRCQRYDFKLISADQIATRLQEVLQAEQINSDDEAIRIIAREAAGSMRDAMSLLDQVIAWVGASGETLIAESVSRVLGVASRSVLHRLGTALVDGDASASLDVIDDLAQQGFDLGNVARDFLAYLRDLVVAHVSKTPESHIELADAELQDLLALAKRASGEDLSRLYLGFSRAYDDVARSGQPRAAIEMALVRLARRPPLVPIDTLIEKLAELERRLLDGHSASGGGGGDLGGGSTPRGNRDDGRGTKARGSTRHASSPTASGHAGSTPQRSAAQFAPPPAPQMPAESQTPARVPSTPQAPAPQAPAPQAPAPQAPAPQAPAPQAPAPQAPAPQAVSREAPARESAREAPSSTSEQLASRDALSDWRDLVELISAERQQVGSVYAHAVPLELAPGRIVVGFEAGSFLEQRARDPEALALVTEVISRHFGQPTELHLDTSGAYGARETVALRKQREREAAHQAALDRVAGHPAVVEAIRELGAELRDVRLPERP